jgi:DNA polymerase III gamma/tau subunit
MRFDFKLIPQADLEERLRYVFDKIGKKYDEEAISAIARAGAGSVRDMLSVADTCVSYTTGKLTYADVNAVLGNADFSEVGKLCKAIFEGDSGKAFEKTEGFLSAGKSVGMLIKDVLNFLNACAVAKTCRDGQAILALPDEFYAQVVDATKAVDGHRLLRTTEIFAKTESEVKYSTSPRILFETAVLKSSMPQEDYDIEALLGRIAALEKKLSEGVVFQNVGGMVATKDAPASINTPVKEVVVEQKQEEVKEEYIDFDVPPDMDVPPDEMEMGGNVYMDAPIVEKAPPKPVEVKPSIPEPVKTAKSAPSGDAKATFGLFLRSIRKVARNGVLIALCMDLDNAYENGMFILYTDSDTVYRSLKKQDHISLIEQAFEAIGIAADGFDVRLKGKPADAFKAGVNEIQDTFGGVKVEIK